MLMVILGCMLISCSMDGSNPEDMTDKPSEEQPSTPSEPETPTGPENPTNPETPEIEEPTIPDTPSEEDPSDSQETVVISTPHITFRGFQRPSRDAVISISKPENATVYYTTDGSIPTAENGINYNRRESVLSYGLNHIGSGVSVPAGCEVKAVAYMNGHYSSVSSMIVPTEISIASPTISIRGTTSGDKVVISLYSNDPEAYIYYTFDGTEPTPGCSRPYSYSSLAYTVDGNRIVEGIAVSHGTTVKAIAYNNYSDQKSGVSTKYIE